MKNWRVPGYKNYGMIPANEYTSNTEKSKNSGPVSGQAAQADDVEYKQHLLNPKAERRLGGLQCRGWLRSRSTNGWRAESASQQDETAHMEGHTNNTRKGKHPFG